MNKLPYNNEKETDDTFKERNKVSIADISGRGNSLLFETNWNKIVKRTGHIKISMNGVESVVTREQLWSILFLLGTAKDHDKLVEPFIKQTRVTKFNRLIGITTEKDIKKGEMINVALEFTLNPETNQVIIGKGSMGGIMKQLSN